MIPRVNERTREDEGERDTNNNTAGSDETLDVQYKGREIDRTDG